MTYDFGEGEQSDVEADHEHGTDRRGIEADGGGPDRWQYVRLLPHAQQEAILY
ncbi:MAG: hypothetical protein HY648_07725 [Acidobacteria bacterium]|nr:hypothetical protein [Acidobacteriota bacterium]